MDSDIDIEEHNLFENPELRVLFPDITELKQEIYNEDIEVTNVPYDQTTQKLEYELELGHSQHFDEKKQRAGKKNPALQPKTCILKNKIVIGSKPKSSKTTDFTMKHNITKQVKIILSDLQPVLLNSNKFCKVCSILFPNNVCLTEHRRIIHNERYICNKCGNNFYQKSNLTRHLKNVHKIKVIRKRKTSMLAKNVQLQTTQHSIKEKNVVPNETCFHCPKKFESKQLLIEHLYAVLEPKVNKQVNSLLNVQLIESNCIVNKRNNSVTSNIQNNMDKKSCGPKQNLERKVNNNETQLYFKCPKCYHYFKNKDFFVKHMKIKHCIKDCPTTKVPFNTKCELCTQHCSNARFYNRHIHNHQLMSLKKKQNSKLKMKRVYTKKATKKETLNIFVLKDVVFKCSKCDICFLSPSLALNHTKHSEYRSHWKCTECQFTFKRNEGKYHLTQHTCSKSFASIEINEKTFSKILYSCSKCNIHYEEQQFMKHCRKCNSYPPPSEYCNICDIFIDQRLKIAHRDIHAASFMNNTDFYILKLIEKTISKPDLVETDSIKNNLHNLMLYYCKTCKCCVTQIHKFHLQSLCAKCIKYACRYCGLFFTNKGIMAHRSIHYKNPSIVLQDFLFYDMKTGKKITPPMPDFLKCEGCCKHFINRFALNKHICGEEPDFICSICNMKFSEIVHKLHLPFHKYDLNESNIEKLPTEEVYSLSNIQKDNIDGLVECNENAKTIVDNDLYFCKLCFTKIYSYDKVIEHCQLHIFNNRDPKKTTEHLAQDVNSKDSIDGTEVYYFEPYYYGAKDDIWLKHLFNELSLEEISKKLFHSIYRFESRIKLEISQEGYSEYTEYKCMKCQCFIERSTLFSHVDECGGHNLKSYSCGVCKNIFISQIALSQHLHMHKNSVNMKNIRIVSFNRDNDKQINELIKLNSSRPYYVVYRCRNCEGLVNKAEFLKHVCNIKDLKKCYNCGLLLYSSDYEYHLLKHKNLNSFTGNNIKVVLLGDLIPGFNKSSLVSTFMGIVCDYCFYKCSKCFVCVRYARCISPHFCLVDAAKAICNLCDLYFEQGKLKGHMKLHSEDPEFIKDNINTLVFNPKETMEFSKAVQPSSSKTNVVKILEQDIVKLDGQIILYRCAKCNLHYMSKSQAKEHVKKSPGRVLKQYCTKCGIPFSPNVLFDHLKNHHKKEINTTIYVVDVFGVYKKRKIFKCGSCNLHFTNAKKTSEHYLKCLGDSSNGEKCKCCSLMFHYSYLLNHEKSTDYNMHTDYEVVEVDSEYVNC